MTKEEKNELVTYRITKARDTFRELDLLVYNSLWNTAVNRLYYGCYYAVIALLINHDIYANTHAGVRQLFGLHFIKTGVIDQDLGKFYSRLFDLRRTGDYDDFIDFSREEVVDLLDPADKLTHIAAKNRQIEQ
ncbi:MAG: HEPN domain-containing protein [Ferruginibacter sp.]